MLGTLSDVAKKIILGSLKVSAKLSKFTQLSKLQCYQCRWLTSSTTIMPCLQQSEAPHAKNRTPAVQKIYTKILSLSLIRNISRTWHCMHIKAIDEFFEWFCNVLKYHCSKLTYMNTTAYANTQDMELSLIYVYI